MVYRRLRRLASDARRPPHTHLLRLDWLRLELPTVVS